jgi:hypothetical protein
MDLFEEPVNTLEYLILFNGIWEIATDIKPTYFKKHSADQAWMYRNTPSNAPEVWCPDYDV